MTADLTKPMFTEPEKAREYLESVRWPHGPICPHCGSVEKITPMKGKSHRPGLYQCNNCREPFSVTVGTLYERSHIPLHKWLLATHLMSASKKGISAHQLHRMLGITYKSAWFMAHRIREAMRPATTAPFGQNGGGVEVDEIFIGTDKTIAKPRCGPAQKHKVLSLIDRTTGGARSMVIDSLKASAMIPILRANIAQEARVLTDSAGYYRGLSLAFAKHDKVDHKAGEYVSAYRSDDSYEYHRRLLFDIQARYEGRLSTLWQATFAQVSGGIRFQVLRARTTWRQRFAACGQSTSWHWWKTANISAG